MEGAMESAVLLVVVYDVEPFRSPLVTLPLFRLNTSPPNCYGICTDDVVVAIQQQKFVLSLQDEDSAGALL